MHWKGNREKERIDTRVWKRLLACKTDGQCACLSEPCTTSPQSLLPSCKISSWLSLCNPLCSMCVSAARTSVNGCGTSSWSQVRDVGCDLVRGGPCQYSRDPLMCTFVWIKGVLSVCCQYWDSASARGGGVVHLCKWSCQSCKQVILKAAPCPWQPVSPSCGCLCTSLLVSRAEQVSCYFLCSLISFYG